ncbi:MAG: aminotransferase class I/II-fold pyridoxal phosphate-dependent enzyme [Clostridia bacterium]|nr:aminotransferase class I/II-fold pyridoxal phosphate-dependent enzyme [Clostridia bacterium]
MIKSMSQAELFELKENLLRQYGSYKSKGLKLDMSRGKPCKEQLDISEGLLSVLKCNDDCFNENGMDCRNYGILDGIPEAKKIFADLMEVSVNEVVVGGNSSLNMMYDTIARAMIFGVDGVSEPWGKNGKITFICPVPGYDRHFSICESLGINMVTVPLNEDGPDMDMIENLVAEDESVKGMWSIPKYSNPTGITYSDEVVKRLAALKPKAKDFRIFWDNAYIIHDLNDKSDKLLNLLQEAKKYGNEDMIYMFMSTSKVSFPGAGVAAMAASTKNVEYMKKKIFSQTIGPDKLNQLRHVRYYKTADGVREYMKKHAAIIKPRFDVVLKYLSKELGGLGVADWFKPNGGYFVSVNVEKGCAKRVVSLLKDAGVTMTNAGATFPYGKDPDDRNIRIAPTYPPIEELRTAMELFCICVKLAAVEKSLEIK